MSAGLVWTLLLLSGLTLVAADTAADVTAHGHDVANTHHSIHVASWRWDEIGLLFTITLFVIICGLAKIAFHHAHFLSTHIPESCLMIIVGVSVGAVIYYSNDGGAMESVLPHFTPRMFFLFLLPPVILEAAYSLYDRAFADNIGTVLLFAVVGTLFNTFAIGFLLYVLVEIGAMGSMHVHPLDIAENSLIPYSLTFTDCLVFAVIISAVDPVAVLAIFQEIGVNKDLYYLVFGESLFNDAVTVVVYATLAVFNSMRDEIPGGEYGFAVMAFLASSLGGLAIGVVFGLVTALITKTTKEISVVEPLAVLGIAYLSYLTAELFHFSGIISIIGCGLTQNHYAMRNVTDKSYTTIIYFTKMLSSTSEAIIFLFLGIVVIGEHHEWHTYFVLWTLLLCLVVRFVGVFSLTMLANVFRVSNINVQEQFIMAYGGLRGAVAFSLVLMLDEETVEPRSIFITTTLVVIFFTVFIQGGTIKYLVSLLKIERDTEAAKTMYREISENIIDNVMSGIEEITGLKGDGYFRRKIEDIDANYLQKVFLISDHERDLTKLYKEIALVEHYAHLYGPVALVEDHTADALLTPKPRDDARRPSIRPERVRLDSFQGPEPGDPADLHLHFRNQPNQKFPRNNPEDTQRGEVREKLRQRYETTRNITALVNKHGDHVTIEQQNVAESREDLDAPKKLIHAVLDGGDFRSELLGIDAILDRAIKRMKSASEHSLATMHSPATARARPRSPDSAHARHSTTYNDVTYHDVSETEMDEFLARGRIKSSSEETYL